MRKYIYDYELCGKKYNNRTINELCDDVNNVMNIKNIDYKADAHKVYNLIKCRNKGKILSIFLKNIKRTQVKKKEDI